MAAYDSMSLRSFIEDDTLTTYENFFAKAVEEGYNEETLSAICKRAREEKGARFAGVLSKEDREALIQEYEDYQQGKTLLEYSSVCYFKVRV